MNVLIDGRICSDIGSNIYSRCEVGTRIKSMVGPKVFARDLKILRSLVSDCVRIINNTVDFLNFLDSAFARFFNFELSFL